MGRYLKVRIHRVTCIDETGGSVAERFGNDEMYMLGFAVDSNNNVTPVYPVSIYGNFDDGDVKNFYNPLLFHQFYVDDVDSPRHFAIGFILCEKDYPGVGMMQRFAEQAASIARASILATGSPMTPGTPQQYEGLMKVAAKVGEWVRSVTNAMADDFFPLVVRTSTVSNGQVSDPYMEYFQVRAHDGTYKVEHDWVLE